MLLLVKKILIQNVFGNRNFDKLFNKYNREHFLYRHIELSSNVSATKYVFTITKYESMAQGKIGFSKLQVRLLFFNPVFLKYLSIF